MNERDRLGPDPIEQRSRIRDQRLLRDHQLGSHAEGHEDVAHYRVVPQSGQKREPILARGLKCILVPFDEVQQWSVGGGDALGDARGARGEQQVGGLGTGLIDALAPWW